MIRISIESTCSRSCPLVLEALTLSLLIGKIAIALAHPYRHIHSSGLFSRFIAKILRGSQRVYSVWMNGVLCSSKSYLGHETRVCDALHIVLTDTRSLTWLAACREVKYPPRFLWEEAGKFFDPEFTSCTCVPKLSRGERCVEMCLSLAG